MKLTEREPVDLAMPAPPPWDVVRLVGQALIALADSVAGRPLPGSAPVTSPRLPASTYNLVGLVNEFLLSKARAQKSDRYLRQIRVSLSSFAQGRANKFISDLSVEDLESWISSHDWAPKTMKGYLGDVRTMFNFAVKRGYLHRNPAAGVEIPADHNRPPEIYAPAEVAQLLKDVRAVDLDVCRVLALRFFAGIRNAECHRLRETDLKLDQALIEVPAAKAKTRARRLVTVQPNLKAWLELGGQLGPLGDMRIRKALRKSSVEWKHNGARHSFVSYHLAQFGSAAKTALEAGHTEQMVFSNYRALVTPAAAAEYWSIVPKAG